MTCSAFLAFAASEARAAPAPPRSSTASQDASRGTPDADSNQPGPFFPPGALDKRRDLDDFRARWYSKHLRAAREPPLLDGHEDPGREAYRFTWLRTFDAPIFVRVEVRRDGSADLIAVVLTGLGGYEPGEVGARTTAKLSRSQVDELRAAFRIARFWDAHEPERIGLDGSQWIVEGVANGRYRVLDRWCGMPDLRQLGLTFLRLAGLGNVEPVY